MDPNAPNNQINSQPINPITNVGPDPNQQPIRQPVANPVVPPTNTQAIQSSIQQPIAQQASTQEPIRDPSSGAKLIWIIIAIIFIIVAGAVFFIIKNNLLGFVLFPETLKEVAVVKNGWGADKLFSTQSHLYGSISMNSSVLQTADGKNWEKSNFPSKALPLFFNGKSYAFGNNLGYSNGESGSAIYSPAIYVSNNDGQTWINNSYSGLPTNFPITNAFIYDSHISLFGSKDFNGNVSLFQSEDASLWEEISLPTNIEPYEANVFAYNKELFLKSKNNIYKYSGNSWGNISATAPNLTFEEIFPLNKYCYLVGLGGKSVEYKEKNIQIYRSSDLINWEEADSGMPKVNGTMGNFAKLLTLINNEFIYVGNRDDTITSGKDDKGLLLYKSKDGINWESFNSDILSKIYYISGASAFKDELYLTDVNNLYRYSSDGKWTKIK
jgi:hypothetical protein